jgi:hypothetical protein
VWEVQGRSWPEICSKGFGRNVENQTRATQRTERFVNISNTPSVQTATAAMQSANSDAVNVLVLKKALNMQASSAMTLLQALPQPPLATQGAVGTRVNTFA